MGDGRAVSLPNTRTRSQSRNYTGIRNHEHGLLWVADSPRIAARQGLEKVDSLYHFEL
jgi:hypothetical protein